jgi:hypothetical protein
MVEKKEYYVPQPHDTPATNPPPGKRAPTPAERVRESYIQAAEVKATVDVLGPKQNTDSNKGQGGLDPSKVGEILGSTMNSYMKSYVDGISSLMAKVVESQAAAGGKGGDKDQFLLYLIQEMKDVKTKLEGGQGDPLEAIDQYHQKMVAWQEQMRTQFGIGPLGSAGNTGNVEVMKLLLEAEDRKTERAQLQLRHDASEAEKNRQFVINRDDRLRKDKKEDDKWDADFKLKLAQLNLDGVNREEATGTFKDVASAFIASLQVNPNATAGAGAGQGAAGAPPVAKEPRVNFPVSFTCTEPNPDTGVPCGTQFAWPAGQMKANCTKCGAEYSLKAAQ